MTDRRCSCESSRTSARQAIDALARLDALGFELERIAQSANERPPRSPREILTWLDRSLAELAFQIRDLERGVALRSVEGAPRWQDLDGSNDGGLADRVAALRPDDVARGVAGFFSDYFKAVGIPNEHRFVADPFRDTRAIPGLYSRKLGELYAGLESVRTAFHSMGERHAGRRTAVPTG